jgi:uncharacterized protein with NRDE domain
MCLISFAYKFPEGHHLILAGNRDEFYTRKTLAADSWKEDPRVWGGRDLENDGAWLGVRVDGRFAFITNYRNLKLDPVSNPISRGHLVRDFLLGEMEPEDYIYSRMGQAESFEGFNLVVGNNETAIYWNNRMNIYQKLNPGIYGLSNGILNENWPKLKKAKEEFTLIIQKDHNLTESNPYFQILQDATLAEDNELPNTGLPFEKEKYLSSIFIQLPGYGTRSSTFVSFPRQGKVVREEKVWI